MQIDFDAAIAPRKHILVVTCRNALASAELSTTALFSTMIANAL